MTEKKSTLEIEIVKKVDLEIHVVTNPDEIIYYETRRVEKYLEWYNSFKDIEVRTAMRFPVGINPDVKNELKTIKEKVIGEFQEHHNLYSSYCEKLKDAAKTCIQILPVVRDVYGCGFNSNFSIGATAYATIGSTYAYGDEGPQVSRIPELIPDNIKSLFTTEKYRSPLEILVHELLSHGLTNKFRKNTTIDDYVTKSTKHWHKEYLMELLGIEILTQSGLMDKKIYQFKKQLLQTLLATSTQYILTVMEIQNGKEI